jgi:hypothetical protein
MSITATNEGGGNFQPLEAGTYPARCISMIHIGTVTEQIMGKDKTLNKVWISWEIPTELKEFKQGEGEKPYVINEEFNLSMNEKATLRKFLESWRGKQFTDDEAKSFDVTKLLGVPCMVSIVHKTSAAGKTFAKISNVSPVMKGFTVPAQINPSTELNYDNFDGHLFESLPEFIRKKIESSIEYKKMMNNNESFEFEKEQLKQAENVNANNDDLPF